LAKLYFNIREYKSAIVALENTLKDYPEIAQKEELEYLTVKSNFLLAQNSIDEKKEERYLNTLSAANDFNMEYQESKYQKEVLSMADKANSEIKKIQSRKQKS
jgi:outer membrane protein assembly factor BamD